MYQLLILLATAQTPLLWKSFKEWNKLQTKLNKWITNSYINYKLNSLLQDKNIPKILQFFKTQTLDSYL